MGTDPRENIDDLRLVVITGGSLVGPHPDPEGYHHLDPGSTAEVLGQSTPDEYGHWVYVVGVSEGIELEQFVRVAHVDLVHGR